MSKRSAPPRRRLRKVMILLIVPALVALGAVLPLLLQPGPDRTLPEVDAQPSRSLGDPEAVVRWAAAQPGPGPQATSVLIPGVPHIRQKPDFCGEACVAMYLQKLGHEVVQRAFVGAADVHARTTAHRLEALEDLDVLGRVILALGRQVLKQVLHSRHYHTRFIIVS